MQFFSKLFSSGKDRSSTSALLPVTAPAPPPTPTLQAAPGELWFEDCTTGELVCALPSHRYDGLCNPWYDALILGGAGSGRSLLLARLAKAAHEAGHFVVNVETRGYSPPFKQLTTYLQGDRVEIKTKQQAQFNPFFFPAFTEEVPSSSWRLPSGAECQYLAGILWLVTQIPRRTSPPAADGCNRLQHFLWKFFQQPWAGEAAPNFNAFYTFLQEQLAPANLARYEDVAEDVERFLHWFLGISRHYFAGGSLDYLLNAEPEHLNTLLRSPNRLLNISINLDESFVLEPGREPVWYNPAPNALQRVTWLLLHAIDMQLRPRDANGKQVRAHQHVRVILSELDYSCLNETGMEFMLGYLGKWNVSHRNTLMAWHENPDAVFRPEHPAALHVLHTLDYHILLPGSHRLQYSKSLDLQPSEEALYLSLSQNKWEIMIRAVNGQSHSYRTLPPPKDLVPFIAPERLARFVNHTPSS